MTTALLRHTRLLQGYCERAFRDGEQDYLGEVAGKLRLLAIDSRQNEPLLLRVMKANNLDIRIRVGVPIRELTVEAFLDLFAGAALMADGKWASYTNRTLIRAWAEQIGAAHEDWNMDEGLRRLLTLPAYVGERQMTAEVLKTAAGAILDVARRCLVELNAPGLIRTASQLQTVELGQWPKSPGLIQRVWARFRRRKEPVK
jgi:hypothetical protein